MDNVLLVVEDLEAVIAFFVELGMELQGTQLLEDDFAGRVIGLEGARSEIAMLRMPDGNGAIELSKFHSPPAERFGPRDAPVNTLGYRRIMFLVDDIDEIVGRLRAQGADLVGEIAQYEQSFRLCFVRGPEGIIIGLAEEVGGRHEGE
jgi:catechol 2,3-dioxygenase-like lactoylglutathione lyase family enzyme